jgi:hypothetical protein
MIAANFRKCPEALATQLCFDFYAAFELLAQLPSKLQEQAIALAAWAKRKQLKKPDAEKQKPKTSVTAQLWAWLKKAFRCVI